MSRDRFLAAVEQTAEGCWRWQRLTHSENSQAQRSASKTHCDNGHEFTPDNTYIKAGGRNGRRMCRACNRDAVRRYKQRKAA